MPDHTYALDATWRTLLADLDIPAIHVLRRAGLPDDLLASTGGRVPSADFYRLWNALEAEVSGRPLAMRIFDVIKAESFSPLLFAALCSPDFVTALRRVAQYKPLIGPMDFRVTETTDQVIVEFCWLDAPAVPPPSLVLAELMFVVALGRMGTREHIRPLSAATIAAPADAGPYQDFLGVALTTGSTHTVSFSAADAALPFLTENEGLWSAFEPDLRQRLGKLQAQASLTTRVRAALHEAIPSGVLDMEAVAARLGLSKRTLQRRMEAEGTSFHHVLQDTREKLARHYLEKTRLPAAEISFLLGFDEPNSFYRAFRRWTGTTPESLRQL